jgi:cysteine desulfurase
MLPVKTVYLDYAASTPVDPAVAAAMHEALQQIYANPSSVHVPGQQSKAVLEEARQTIAGSIGAAPGEIVFTSGGTESNNLALTGTAHSLRARGNHIITTGLEHPSVLECCKYLESQGFRVTYLKADERGQIDLDELQSALSADTILVSVMTANNETGCILPVGEIGQLLKGKDIVFHSDGVQAYGKTDFSLRASPVSLLSLSAHKIYGPKGTGALYIRQGCFAEKILFGGAQELNRRAGTENLPGIVGFASAVQQLDSTGAEGKRIKMLRDYFESELKQKIPGVQVNGEKGSRLFSHANIYFPFMSGEDLLVSLDLQGIAVSVGPACSSGSPRPSHVLAAMGLEPQRVKGSVRFSCGRYTTREEIDYTIATLVELYRQKSKVPPDVR